MGAHRAYRERKFVFGQQLLTLRTRGALTQVELATQVGVHRRSVQKWETGESYPKAATLRRLIAALFRHDAFTEGHESAEAQALWQQAAQDGPQAIGAFDAAWFARMRGREGPGGDVREPEGAGQAGLRALVDWGEAPAVPTMYGRARERETLRGWLADERCRVIAIVGLGGIGKSSLTISAAHDALPSFDLVLFRSLQHGPLLAEVLDQIISVVSEQRAVAPRPLADKIALLVQLFRRRRCLLILDNFEAILQPDAVAGAYRTGYADYAALLRALSEREHRSCLLLTSREQPSELAPLVERAGPVRRLRLTGLDGAACARILAAKDVGGAAADLDALARLYGGNPLALMLVAEPIRELFGGDVRAFLAAGDPFFNGAGTLLHQHVARSTRLEQALLFQLAIEREPVPLSRLLAHLDAAASQRAALVALESLSRRTLIERGPGQPAFTLQPVIREYVTEHLVQLIGQEIVDGQPDLLQRHALIQSTASDFVRHSQEQLIATPLLEWLSVVYGDPGAVERRLTTLLERWRGQPHAEQRCGPGNIVNLLRLLRGDLDDLDLSNILIRQLYLTGTTARAANLSGSHLTHAVFTEPFAGIEVIACTPDMRYLAAGTVSGEVRVWDVATRAVLLAIQGHASAVVGLAMSADGRLLASGGGDRMVCLWDVASGGELARYAHPTLVHSVAWVEDGRLLASAGGDGVVRLWDVRSGASIASLEGHTQAIWGVAASADGRLLASASFDGTARLWGLSDVGGEPTHIPSCLAVLRDHSAGVYSVALSADGRLLVTGSADRSVRVWDLSALLAGAGHEAACLAVLQGHTDTVRSVGLTPDGRLVASGSGDGTARLWDVQTTTSLARFEGHTSAIWSVALAANGQLLASGSTDGTLRLWDTRRGTAMLAMHGFTNAMMSVALAPDGQLLASGGMDGTVQLWDALAGASLGTLSGHSNMVVGVAFSPDGRRLASSAADRTIRLWDARSGDCLITLEGHTNVVRSVGWSADGRLLASASYDGTVRLWDTAAALAVGTQGEVALAAFRGHTNMVMSVALAHDGRLLASGSYDRTVRLWDTSSQSCLAVLEGHTGAIWSVALSADGRLLVSGSTDGSIRVWDVASRSCLAILEGHTNAVWSVALSADGHWLASGDGDGAVRLWDVARGVCLAVWEGHASTVWSVAMSSDGELIVSGSTDGTVRVWEHAASALRHTLRAPQPYADMDITNLTGISDAQRTSLMALGAADRIDHAPARN